MDLLETQKILTASEIAQAKYPIIWYKVLPSEEEETNKAYYDKSIFGAAVWFRVGVMVEWRLINGEWNTTVICTEPDSKRRTPEEFYEYYGVLIPSQPPWED